MGVAHREKSKFRRYWQVKMVFKLIQQHGIGGGSPLGFLFLFTKYLHNKSTKTSWTYNTADVGLYMDEKSLETGIVHTMLGI